MTPEQEFLAAIAGITSQVRMRELEEAIAARDELAVYAVLDLEPAVFAGLAAVLINEYNSTGRSTLAATRLRDLTGRRIVVHWNQANPGAEQYLRYASSDLITLLDDDTRRAVRVALNNGYAQGRGPRQIALDIAGRRVGQRRVGGIIGLNEPQTQWVTNMRAYLQNRELSRVLGMTKRDRRFDSLLRRGDPLSSTQIDRMTQAYSDRLLKLRADTIARTETAHAVEAAKTEAFQQYVDKSGVPEQYIIRRWDHPGGRNSRDWHSEMNGMEVRGLTTPFITPRGAALMYPHDTSLGAGAEEVANCRCMQTIRVDYAGMERDGL